MGIVQKNWFLILVLIATGFVIYFFNLNNELFWDDEDWILNNIYVHDISWDNVKFWLTHNTLAGIGLKSNYYRPFLFFTFAVNYIVSGAEPWSYHLLSNSIHIFNSILVFWLVYLIFKRRLLSFLVSFIFLIHPLQTEAVTYVAGRGDLLVAMFMLSGLIVFYRSLASGETRSKASLAGSIGFLIFALLSRETAIVFPLLALILYVSVISREKFLQSVKEGLIKTWPYFAVVIIYGILRLTVFNFLNTLNFYAEPNPYSENLHIRLFTFLSILWEYIRLLAVPIDLHMERGAAVYDSLFQWPVWIVATAIVILLYCLVVFYKKEKFNNSTIQQFNNLSFRVWFFGVSWFLVALGPVSGITPINALIYEHWLYLPMIGFWLIVSFYLVKLFDYFSRSLASGEARSKASAISLLVIRLLLIIGLAGYFSFFVYQSIQRNILWGNREEFYKNILRYEPQSARINNNLGNLYFNRGDMEQAEAYYRKAVESGDVFAQPYFNLGSMLQSKGDIYGAIQLYEEAVRINPNFFYPYQNLAVVYAEQGQLTKAVENIEKLKSLIPENPRVYYNSALVYIALGNKDKALEDLKIGIRYSGSDFETDRLIEELIEKLEK